MNNVDEAGCLSITNIVEWQDETEYTLGDYVTVKNDEEEEILYQCKRSHTGPGRNLKSTLNCF